MEKSAKELNAQMKNKLPQIIEYFIEVYGEVYRERISSRLNNTVFVFAGEKELPNGDIDEDFIDDTISFIDESGLFLGRDTYLKMLTETIDKGSIGGGVLVSSRFDEMTTPRMICYFPYFEGLDNARLFHELNHIIQTDIYQKTNGITTRSGLLRASYEIDADKKEATRADSEKEADNARLYEGLNEVLNDYLSLKVLKVAEKNGFKFSDAENIEASYAAAYPMMDKFIDENIGVIIICMLDGKKGELVNLIGGKNLDKLADSINALLDFEDKNYEKEVEKMKSSNLDMSALLKMEEDKVPKELKYYVNLCRNIKDLVDEVEQEQEIGE